MSGINQYWCHTLRLNDLALNQVSQGDTMMMPREAASLRDSRFCAAAVMHMALEWP